jgi:hypothetical protein
MFYRVQWLVPNRIVYSYGRGVLTAEAIKEGGILARDLIAAGKPPVYHLIDTLDIVSIPLNPLNFLNGERRLHPNEGKVVIVTSNKLLRVIANVGIRMLNGHSRHFESVEDGLRFLSEADATLPPFDELLKLYQRVDESIPREAQQQ